ncbi:MAG: hypothetical protein V4550_08355 [Gemmatimonadota bacterium]
MTAQKSTGRAIALYGLSCLVVVGLAGGIMTAVFDAAGRPAVWVSAAVAIVVQLVAFAIARMMADKGNGIAGWGVGALICLAALIVYGFASRALGLPQTAALVSLATYFSLTELIEAPFLFL